MGSSFQIIRFEIGPETLEAMAPRERNQLVGCMHAHNEIAALNRILSFSMNDTGSGELHDAAQAVQMWCLLQVPAGRLYETWNMVRDRFLKARPTDPGLMTLSLSHRASLDWLSDYFGVDQPKQNALRILRDKTAFHYDKLSLARAAEHVGHDENVIFVAQHPANSLYYVGSSLVFRSVFTLIAGLAGNAECDQARSVAAGFQIAVEETRLANLHLHQLLYGLIKGMLERMPGRPLDPASQVRIEIIDAPRPEAIGLPAFISIENANSKPAAPRSSPDQGSIS